MGAGKSTVGRALAQILGFEFVDSDAEIEARTGADIPWIFEIEGESGFRDRETKVIEDVSSRDTVVMATGGGAILRDENRSVLTKRGFVVYLEATLREQVRRTSKDQQRPLLSGQDRRRVLTELMATREPLYKEIADLTLPTAKRNARQLAEQIVSALEGVVPASGP
jgi:shikimate kinase